MRALIANMIASPARYWSGSNALIFFSLRVFCKSRNDSIWNHYVTSRFSCIIFLSQAQMRRLRFSTCWVDNCCRITEVQTALALKKTWTPQLLSDFRVDLAWLIAGVHSLPLVWDRKWRNPLSSSISRLIFVFTDRLHRCSPGFVRIYRALIHLRENLSDGSAEHSYIVAQWWFEISK